MKLIRFFVTTLGVMLFSSAPSIAADLKFDLFLQGSINYSDGEDQAPAAGFVSDFQPAGGSMSTEDQENWGLDLRLGIEPSWQLQSGWRVGVVSWYNFSAYSLNSDTGEQDFFTTERIVSETSLDWWDDVTVVDLILKTDTPAIGFSIAKDRLKFAFAVQHYDLIRRDYEGEDKVNAPNDSDVKSETKIDDGFGQIFQFWYQLEDTSNSPDRSSFELGVFYERYGSDAWFVGVGIRANLNFRFSE